MLFVLARNACILRAGAFQFAMGLLGPPGNLESLGCVPSILNHCPSSAGCSPNDVAGVCALHCQPGCFLARILILIVNEAMELSRDEKRVEGGRMRERKKELLSFHAGHSPCRVGDSIFGSLLS